MRAAPPVAAPVGDGRPERVLITLLYALTGAVLAAWAGAMVDLPDDRLVTVPMTLAGALLGLLVGRPVARRLLPGDLAQLAWDGRAWAVRSAGGADPGQAVASLAVVLDLGPWLLLKLGVAPGQVRWLVLHQRQAGKAWHLLRVALRAHAGMRR